MSYGSCLRFRRGQGREGDKVQGRLERLNIGRGEVEGGMVRRTAGVSNRLAKPGPVKATPMRKRVDRRGLVRRPGAGW